MRAFWCIALLAALSLGGCADISGGEGWSISRSAADSLRRHGCGNTLLDNPALAQQVMSGRSTASGAPMLGCSLRMGNPSPG